MHLRRFLILAAVFISVSHLAAQPTHSTTIELLRNEKWWGAYVGGGLEQPFVRPFVAAPLEYGGNGFTTPMMISSAGRYIWSAHPMEARFDGDAITIVSDYEKVQVQKGGRTLREAYLVCYHKNLGPSEATVPRDFLTCPVYDLGITDGGGCEQDKILEYAAALTADGMPAGIILISDGWQSYSRELDFNRELYPDPGEMIRQLHARGFKVMLAVTPYIRAAGKNYTRALGGDLLLTGRDGEPVLIETPAGYSACLDISSERVARQMEGNMRTLSASYAIDGFLFDCRGILEKLNGDKNRMLRFAANWNRLGNGCKMAAYAPALNAAPAAHVNWMAPANDLLSWDNLSAAATDKINAGLTGHIYSCFPTGSTGGGAVDEELLLRAAQLALTSDITVLPPSPDAFKNPQYREALKQTMRFRVSLCKYLEELLAESANTAEPLIRHLEYQFPGQGFANCADQFMIGSRYLVAPVLCKSGKRTVRLPKGTWTADDGLKYKGPRVITLDVSGGRIPVFTLQGK